MGTEQKQSIESTEVESSNSTLYEAEQYYQKAMDSYWENNFKEATHYFEKAINLGMDIPNLYWRYADALQLSSYTKDFPFRNKDLLLKAELVWKKYENITQSSDYWAYHVAAFIYSNLVSLPDATDYSEKKYHSLWFCERALVWNRERYEPWLNLANAYLEIGFIYNSFLCLRKAKDFNFQESTWSLEVEARLNLHAGFLENLTVLTNLQKNNPEVLHYSHLWEGYRLSYQNHFKEALILFVDYVQKEPTIQRLWVLYHQSRCLWFLKSWDQLTPVIQNLLEYEKLPEGSQEEEVFAFAYFVLKQWDQAANHYQRVIERSNSINDENNSQWACIYELYRGDLNKACEHFDVFLKYNLSLRNHQEITRVITHLLELEEEHWSQQVIFAPKLELLEHWKKILVRTEEDSFNGFEDKCQDDRYLNNLAKRELSYAIERGIPQLGEVPQWSFELSQARQAITNRDYSIAVNIYKKLHNVFPEAALAYQQTNDSILAEWWGLLNSDPNKIDDQGIASYSFESNHQQIEQNSILALYYLHFGDDEQMEMYINKIAHQLEFLPVDETFAGQYVQQIFEKIDPSSPLLIKFLRNLTQHLSSTLASKFNFEAQVLGKANAAQSRIGGKNIFQKTVPIITLVIPIKLDLAYDLDIDIEALKTEFIFNYGLELPPASLNKKNPYLYDMEVEINEQIVFSINLEPSTGSEGYSNRLKAELSRVLATHLDQLLNIENTYKYIQSTEGLPTLWAEDPNRVTFVFKVLKRLVRLQLPLTEKKLILQQCLEYVNEGAYGVERCVQALFVIFYNQPVSELLAFSPKIEEWISLHRIELGDKQCIMSSTSEVTDIIEKLHAHIEAEGNPQQLRYRDNDMIPLAQQLVDLGDLGITVLPAH